MTTENPKTPPNWPLFLALLAMGIGLVAYHWRAYVPDMVEWTGEFIGVVGFMSTMYQMLMRNSSPH